MNPPQRSIAWTRRHIISPATKFIIPFTRTLGGTRSLIPFHVPSMVLVWTPVTGSLKWREWLTVWWCMFKVSARPEYPFHRSVSTMDPGATWWRIMFRSVSADLSGTSTRNIRRFSVRSTPPRSQTPLTRWPRLFFRFPIVSVTFTKFTLINFDCDPFASNNAIFKV